MTFDVSLEMTEEICNIAYPTAMFMIVLYFMTIVIRREDYLRTNSVLLWQLTVIKIRTLSFVVMENRLLHVSLKH